MKAAILASGVVAFLARAAHQAQLLRLRLERFLSQVPGQRTRPRVLATACWAFPIYSQTFVYQELTQLHERGFTLRFLYSKLNSRRQLPAGFAPLWRARRRLFLHPAVCRADYEYYARRMPERVDRLLDLVCRASGIQPAELRGHKHFLQAFSFTRMVEAYHPDYLHSYFFYEGSFFALCTSILLDIPRGVTCYADHMLDDYELKLVPFHLEQCSLVVATSGRIKQELMQIAPGAPADRIVVKPNAIDPDRFPVSRRREPPAGAPYRLVSVSRIEPKKGLIYLIEALRDLRDRMIPVEAHLLGAPDASPASLEYFRGVTRRITELGLDGVVHLEGQKSEVELRHIFERAHVFVAPFVEMENGDKDGIPTSLLEAMASGFPVVATDAGSISEVIEDGRDGILVPQRSAAALSQAIEALINDPHRRERLGQEAARTVRRHFDVQTCESILEERVRNVIGGNGTIQVPPARPWRILSLPHSLTRIPSMLSEEEKQYLIWLAAERFEGWGAVVDLGPWLGSSSAALAEGLKRRGAPSKVHSFDLFRWEPEPGYMAAVAGESLPSGADFLPWFRREIGDYAPWIEPHTQNLMDFTWDGGAIEILFVDAAKSWELTNAILKGFGADLVPGRSRVVLQDFRYYGTHWLPLIFESRPDLWKETESVEDGTTVTFVPLKPLLGEGGVDLPYSEEVFPLQTATQLLRSRMARESERNRKLMLGCLHRKTMIDGSFEQAGELRREVFANGVTPKELALIENAEMLLVPRGWQAWVRQDYQGSKRLAERCFNGPGARPVYAVALLGMSLLRLGDLSGARKCIEEVIARKPGFLGARLYRAEVELREGRHRAAAADALSVLTGGVGDEPLIEYALGMLDLIWSASSPAVNVLDALNGLHPVLADSPAFLTRLAQEQFKVGVPEAALESIQKALAIAPDQTLAARLLAEWTTS